MKFPCRSTIPDIAPSVPMEEYDINEHLAILTGAKVEAAEFVL